MKRLILALLLAILPAFPVISHATVSNGTNQVIYNGDGVTSIFNFSFNVYNTASENDLLVSELNTTTGAVTNLVINSDYTVNLTHSTPSPGTVTLIAGALAVGTNLSILRQLPLTQNVTESDNSATPASVRNNVYDRQVMVSQQLQQQLTRAVLQNIFATTSITLPAPVANFGLCWDTTGTILTNCATLAGSIGVPIANSNLQTLTQANLVNGSSLFGNGKLTSLVTTGNVGVASITPGDTLDVQGTLRVTNITTGNTVVFQDQASDPTPFVIDANGNVGVGSTLPGIALDVVGTVRATSFTGRAGSGLIGTWDSTKAVNTIYGPVASDFFVFCNAAFTCTSSGGSIGFMTDSNTTPVGNEQQAGCQAISSGSVQGGVSSLVRKGDYWECGDAGAATVVIRDISIGS